MAQTARWHGIFTHPLLWLRNSARAERDRWALWLPVGMGAGIGIYFALPSEPPLWSAFAFAGIGIVVCAIAVFRSFAVPFLIGLLAATCFGFSIAKFRTEFVAAPILTHKVAPTNISGCVESVRAKNDGMQAVLNDLAIQRLNPLPQKIRMSFRNDDPALQPGTCIQFKGVLMPPPGPAEPGGYDFGRSAFFERIGAVGYAYGRPRAIANFGETTFREKISIAIEHLRFAMSQRIHAALPGSTGAIAAALITGDRGGISEDDESALRDAGLAHVLAIAGLHMALVGLGLFWAVRAILALFPTLALTQPIKKWAALAALCSASFYLIISGAATPASRAFVMLAMMMLSVLADRPTLSMRSLASAAAIILLFTPESIIEPGFQMSFAAVASLIAIAEWEQSRARTNPLAFERPRFAALQRYMGGIAITSFVGSLATAPYAIYHFDRAAHYAILGNLLAMPVMGFVVMPMAAIAVILMPFGLETIPLQLMGWGIEVMLSVGKWVSHLPGAVSTVAVMPISALITLSLGGLWILLWRSAWRWLGLLPMAISLVLIFAAKQPDLLVSRDGLTVAIRQSSHRLELLREAKDEYSASEWLKRDGDSRTPDEAVAGAPAVRCDEFGCITRAPNGMTVAAGLRIEALAEDCARADIVITPVRPRWLCQQPKLVIGRHAITIGGGYAVWFGDKIKFKTVEGERGDRPWSMLQRPKPKSQSAGFSNGG
ncbi:MAG TPA: ComEC/Rec2 family competence protein [Rhizomicrobium sp.]|jgi:competence protein ComEC|nr:ComEC/Rec2 family competence protein [Rhizomicrobium sp.]